jgi:molybdenum cofactor biosynthesis enzyme MoaA
MHVTRLAGPRTSAVTDLRGRDLRDLRISVTDRCNFRCTYCMPRDKFGPDHTFMSCSELLRYDVADVLAGIDAAVDAGLGPVKINTVVQRGTTDDTGRSSALDVADHFRGTGHIVRFIELTDVGTTNGWQPRDMVPAAENLAALDARFGVEPVDPAYAGEVATRYRYCDGSGEFGIIRSMSAPFCGDCTRAGLSADGRSTHACSRPRD